MPTVNEEVARIEEREKAREKRLGNAEAVLYGNGSPGLIRQIDRLVIFVKILVVLSVLNIVGTAAPNLRPLIAAINGVAGMR